MNEAAAGPDLGSYDWIVVNSSAGKDSLAMLDVICSQAEAAGLLGRVVVVHCDLGRVEWRGTRELAEAQAKRYGVRFEVVSRRQGDLLDHVQERGMWPSPKQRYCTSDHKRDQVGRVYTALAKEARTGSRPVRILSCQGMRAQESPARGKLVTFTTDKRSTNGRRTVDIWLPIHAWTVEEVWARINGSRAADLSHPAYAYGMPRLSCVFCIFAPKAALILAGKHNPELLDAYVAVEKTIGHTFRADLSIAEVKTAVDATAAPVAVADWTM